MIRSDPNPTDADARFGGYPSADTPETDGCSRMQGDLDNPQMKGVDQRSSSNAAVLASFND